MIDEYTRFSWTCPYCNTLISRQNRIGALNKRLNHLLECVKNPCNNDCESCKHEQKLACTYSCSPIFVSRPMIDDVNGFCKHHEPKQDNVIDRGVKMVTIIYDENEEMK